MRVTEERLSEMLARTEHVKTLSRANPVAVLIVEALAASEPEHRQTIREVGACLLGLLGSSGDTGPALSYPVALQVLMTHDRTEPGDMRAHLARLVGDDLLLGVSAQALLSRPVLRRRRTPRRSRAEQDAALKVVYLLVRMFQAQEEVDELNQTLRRSREGEIVR